MNPDLVFGTIGAVSVLAIIGILAWRLTHPGGRDEQPFALFAVLVALVVAAASFAVAVQCGFLDYDDRGVMDGPR